MPSSDAQTRPASNPLKRPRQDPVSCQFCRSKKLKCNRLNPCSNCSARGLPCDGGAAPVAKRSPTIERGEEDAGGKLSVLARLKRLEEIVLGKPAQSKNGLGCVTAPATNIDTKATSSPSLACLSPSSEYQEAVHELEETGARCCFGQAPWSSSGGLDIRIIATHQIAVDQDKLVHLQPASMCLCLPPRAEAMILFEHYFNYIDLLQHVVHVPTVQATMQSVYASLENGLPVVPSDVVLLLSIFASAAALSTYFPVKAPTFLSASDASLSSTFWTNSALEVLEFARRTTGRRLGDIQAGIILGFLLFHSEGFSTRARCVFASAVAMARDLALHKIDVPTSQTPASPLEMEIKRRVWWHVAATDWLLALSGGPQEGTYFVQTRHMRVKMPRNIDDEDLMNESPSIDKPLSEPTSMSYYIQRIKLADICRTVIDIMPLTSYELGTVDYQDVIDLDRKFEAFLHNLPHFFKLDEHHIRESEAIMRERPHMQIQRYALGMIALTRRCKLHQPFLIRRSVDNHYDYSRRISLESARSVIRMRDLLSLDERGEFVNVSAKHTGVVYHIFMSAIVLVMDLTFNKAAEGEDDAARKAEVVAACKMLEDAKSQSTMASEFLESLMDVLRKHKVRLHNHGMPPGRSEGVAIPQGSDLDSLGIPFNVQQSFNHAANSAGGGYLPTPDSQQAPEYNNTVSDDISQHYLSDFDAIWKEYVELGPNMDMPGWDSLFSDLDSRF